MSVAQLLREGIAFNPAARAIAGDGRAVTFAELDQAGNRVANALRAGGVGRGDRVAFVDRNSTEYWEVFLGTLKAGAVLVPLNFRLGPGRAHLGAGRLRCTDRSPRWRGLRTPPGWLDGAGGHDRRPVRGPVGVLQLAGVIRGHRSWARRRGGRARSADSTARAPPVARRGCSSEPSSWPGRCWPSGRSSTSSPARGAWSRCRTTTSRAGAGRSSPSRAAARSCSPASPPRPRCSASCSSTG